MDLESFTQHLQKAKQARGVCMVDCTASAAVPAMYRRCPLQRVETLSSSLSDSPSVAGSHLPPSQEYISLLPLYLLRRTAVAALAAFHACGASARTSQVLARCSLKCKQWAPLTLI